MRPAEPESLQFVIGVTDEIPVGKEQEFDDIPAQIGRARGSRTPFRSPRIRVARGI
jgi:hypothetical protein